MQFPNATNSLQPCNPKNEKNDFKANRPYTKANKAKRLIHFPFHVYTIPRDFYQIILKLLKIKQLQLYKMEINH